MNKIGMVMVIIGLLLIAISTHKICKTIENKGFDYVIEKSWYKQ